MKLESKLGFGQPHEWTTHLFVDKFGELPSVHEIFGYFEAELVIDFIEKQGWELLLEYDMSDTEDSWVLFKKKDIPFFIKLEDFRVFSRESIVGYKDDNEEKFKAFEYFQILTTSEVTDETKDEFFKQFNQFRIEIKPRDNPIDKPRFDVLLFDRIRGYDTLTQSIHDWYDNTDELDIYYGAGMNQFHVEYLKRMENLTKGITLFHGEPGCGKTYYIRNLLYWFIKLNKTVLYLPVTMIDKISDPDFLPFLINYCANNEQVVVVIEDGEKLITSDRDSAIHSVLNMGDGLYNDILNVQFIITFNCDVKEIDKAILRDGRLIAKKEFGRLNLKEAEKLASHLNIPNPCIDYPKTIAEIFAMKNNDQNNILIER